jgi:serine/threonine protein kinase
MAGTRDALPAGAIVGNYRIRSAIGKGGFSLIYLADDHESGGQVVVKEYMPKNLAHRDRSLQVVPFDDKHAERLHRGRKLFFQEAKILASLRHPNIVKVLGLFLANNTVYMAMQYERGKNLGNYVRERSGRLSTRFIFQVFLPVLDALSLMHSRSILHLDVKPSNIHLRHGNVPLLLDFGAVHLLSQERPLGAQIVTAGYSPVEQYHRVGHIGPWSDVYAVGASLRTCIEGKTPPPALARQQQGTVLVPAKKLFRDRYPPFLLKAVDWAMEMDPKQRPQNAGELLHALDQFDGEPSTFSSTQWDSSEIAMNDGEQTSVRDS